MSLDFQSYYKKYIHDFIVRLANTKANITDIVEQEQADWNETDVNSAAYILNKPTLAAGDVVGPSVAVDSRFAAFDGTTGKLIKDSTYSSASFLKLSGGTMTGDIVLANDPTSALHPATKSYVDNFITGITWKNSCLAATTANITLIGTQTIDGVAVTVGKRVLVKNQTTQTNNGIYVCAAGAWSRATDADSDSEVETATVFIAQGTINKDTQWTCTATSVTLGSTNITFAQISGAGTYAAGSGLSLSSNVFSIAAGGVSNTMLANSTISGISLGSSLNSLTIGTGLSGGSYNGSGSISIAIDSTVATLTGSQSLTNKTLTASTNVLGGITMTLGSDASYDIYCRSASGVLTRIANGTTGQVFTATTGAAPGWATPSSSGTTINSTTITGGSANRLLFENSSNQFGESANLTFNLNTLAVTGTATATGAIKLATFTTVPNTNQTLSTEINGILFDGSATRQWATGAITTQREFLFKAPTYSFVGASTITNSATLAVEAAPIQGTSATLTNKYAIWSQAGNNRFDGNTAFGALAIPTQPVHVLGTANAANSSGSVQSSSLRLGTTAAPTNGVAMDFGVAGVPGGWIQVNIANDMTSRYPLQLNPNGGGVSIGTTANANAQLVITAGTTTLAPIKLTSGTNLTTPVAGCIEYNGTNFFATRTGTTRENILIGNDAAAAPATSLLTAFVNYYGASMTNALGTPNSWASVVISGTTYKIPLYT